ncbi:hypothetical protein BRC97_02570 [Halobacteriales archaeon QS_6_71_20]|nr:MAG: hypothetical protein BRC97_02570 [Halobacteriales archaeon QS_6_71_20]
MVEIDLRRVALGGDTVATRRALAGAVLLWLASLAAFAAAGLVPGVDLPVRFYLPVLAVMLLAGAMAAAADAGLLVSLGLATAPATGYYLSLSAFDPGGPVRTSLVDAAGLSLLFGVPVGAVGYLAGRTVVVAGRRLGGPMTA